MCLNSCMPVQLSEADDDDDEWVEGYEPPLESQTGAKRRVKRQQAEAYNFNGERTRCPLLLVADYRFFKEMGGSNYKTTVNYLVGLDIVTLAVANDLYFFFIKAVAI